MQLYKTFVGRSTNLGIFFPSVGNTELGIKMASYTTDQKVFINKPFHSPGGSCLALVSQYC